MASSVPASTTEYPLVSDPILTSLYCATNCSCKVGACAPANEAVKIATARRTTPGIRPRNSCDIVGPPIFTFPQFARPGTLKTGIRSNRLGLHGIRERRPRRSLVIDDEYNRLTTPPRYCPPPPLEAVSCLTCDSV